LKRLLLHQDLLSDLVDRVQLNQRLTDLLGLPDLLGPQDLRDPLDRLGLLGHLPDRLDLLDLLGPQDQ
jgi:hypothetical protein